MVELSPNRGAKIATCPAEEARLVFEARRIVETAILRKLVDAASSEAIDRLRSLVADERHAYATARVADARRLSRAFHLLLAEVAGNRLLRDFLKSLIDRQPLLSWTSDRTRACFCGNAAHAEIISAIECSDADAAVSANAKHLEESERALIADTTPGDVAPSAPRRARSGGANSPAYRSRLGMNQ